MACVARVRTIGPRSGASPASFARTPRRRGRMVSSAASARIPDSDRDGAAPVRDVELRPRHGVDRPLVALLGGGAPREEPVPLEHDDRRLVLRGDPLVLVDAALREREAGHHVGDPHQPLAEELREDGLPVRLIGERQDRVGVRVVDEARREERVEQRLDARGRSRRVEQVRAELVHHRLVGRGHRGCEVDAAARAARPGAPRGSMVARSHPEPLMWRTSMRLAEDRLPVRLHRGIAAAVEHQRRVAADEARRVRAERERLGGARREIVHHLRGGIGVVAAFHGAANVAGIRSRREGPRGRDQGALRSAARTAATSSPSAAACSKAARTRGRAASGESLPAVAVA